MSERIAKERDDLVECPHCGERIEPMPSRDVRPEEDDAWYGRNPLACNMCEGGFGYDDVTLTMCAFCREKPAAFDSPVACSACFLSFMGLLGSFVASRDADTTDREEAT